MNSSNVMVIGPGGGACYSVFVAFGAPLATVRGDPEETKNTASFLPLSGQTCRVSGTMIAVGRTSLS